MEVTWIEKRLVGRLEGSWQTPRVFILGHAILWETQKDILGQEGKKMNCNSVRLLKSHDSSGRGPRNLRNSSGPQQAACRTWASGNLSLALSLPSFIRSLSRSEYFLSPDRL